MSLLENLVAQVVKNSLGGQSQPANQANAGLGGLLGQVLGGQTEQNKQQEVGLGGLLGGLAGQLGGQSAQSNNVLGGVLGSLLAGQKNNVPASDLGSVLGSLIGGASQQKGGLNKNTLLLALLPVVLGYIQKNGGLSGVLAKFNNNGLGNKAQSWVGIDANNDGLDAADIARLFDDNELNQACQQTGASKDEVCQGIAELLPQVVNDLTPHGDVAADEVQANSEISELLGQLTKSYR